MHYVIKEHDRPVLLKSAQLQPNQNDGKSGENQNDGKSGENQIYWRGSNCISYFNITEVPNGSI